MVLLVLVGGLFFWRVKRGRANAARHEAETLRALSKDDLVLLLKSQASTDRVKARNIVVSEESRKAFLKGLKEYLALAAHARREGLADDSNTSLSLRLKENGVLADLYLARIKSKNPSFAITPDQIKSFWSTAGNEEQFAAEMEALFAVQDAAADAMESTLGRQPKPQGETLEKVRTGWARARIVSTQARADTDFMRERTVQLRLEILEAGVLSAAYLARNWKQNIKANDADISAYLASHPEWDLKKKHEKAEMILRRAKAGEDFAALAKQFSEDRPTRDKGGLYDTYELGAGLWKEVEDAAMKLQPGQIADRLVETKDGYHIVQLVDRNAVKKDDGTETVYLSIRHILLQRRFEDPTVNRAVTPLPPPFKTPEEIAKTAVEKEKRQRFIDGVIAKENISLPDDIEVDAEMNALLQR